MQFRSYLPGHRVWAALVAGFALLASPTPTPAAPAADLGSLDMIPEAAQIVVHLRGIKGVANRAMAFLEKALPEQILGRSVDTPIGRGVDQQLSSRRCDALVSGALADDGRDISTGAVTGNRDLR